MSDKDEGYAGGFKVPCFGKNGGLVGAGAHEVALAETVTEMGMNPTEWGKAALERLIGGKADPHKNPFTKENGRTYMRFDSLEIKAGQPDEFGRPQKSVTFRYRGVDLYVMDIPNVGPHNNILLQGIEGRTEVSVN